MKRLYLHNTLTTFTGNEELLQLLQSVIAVAPVSLEYGPLLSCTVPTNRPTNRTKDYYTEQHIFNAKRESIAVIREGKLQTLDKTKHPFANDVSTKATIRLDEPPTKIIKSSRALREKTREAKVRAKLKEKKK